MFSASSHAFTVRHLASGSITPLLAIAPWLAGSLSFSLRDDIGGQRTRKLRLFMFGQMGCPRVAEAF